MNVESLGNLLHSLLGLEPGEKSKVSKGSTQLNAPPDVKVDISLAAQQLQKLKADLGSISGDFRLEKVDHYTKILETGSYNVNAEEVIQNLVYEHLVDTTR